MNILSVGYWIEMRKKEKSKIKTTLKMSVFTKSFRRLHSRCNEKKKKCVDDSRIKMPKNLIQMTALQERLLMKYSKSLHSISQMRNGQTRM